jgi:hypothetical protein
MRRWLVLLALLWALPVEAATRTVGSGKTHATIQACATVAVAGDTCEVYAGTYTEATITPANSGTAGNPIIFLAHAGDTVTVVGKFVLTNRNYITIDGFVFTGGQAVKAADDQENGSAVTTRDLIIKNNIVAWPSKTSTSATFQVYGDNLLIEYNDVSASGSDFTDIGGTNVVIRSNRFHDIDASASGEHIDFVQVIGGGVTPTLRYGLIEGNVFSGCVDDTHNCHFLLQRTGTGEIGTNAIVRFNYAVGLDGSGIGFGGSGDDVQYGYAYANTIATGYALAESGLGISWQNATSGASKNNIFFNSMGGGSTPIYSQTPAGGTFAYDGDIAYTTGYASTWTAPYSTESTYATLRNVNPTFANAPTNGTLTAGSGAIGAGVALTTVAVADSGSGTSLVVADAAYFQPGWAGVTADQIRIGASTTTTIASIDYGTNTITLAGGVSRSDGDAVYLYARSDGQVVLNTGAPDVGAYPYNLTPLAPTAITVGGTSTLTVSWSHGGANVTRFETVVDSATPRNVGKPTPSGTVYSTTLPTFSTGAHTLTIRACAGTLCTASAPLIVVKM